ncbi:UPF0187-domain-containing protein [Mycena alexandri]|uniref:UPF0187-domain-containing protein n=1 Tax=Mycena alexandri TaxID=1745969 RepID=A0AAD6X913_9AGAR|nr:UPF0187-domain-containing protein [Mycena alexandri]
MSSNRAQGSRSLNGGRSLLPAIKPSVPIQLIPEVPTLTLVAWTFGRGSVIWKIWPAVLLHTLFAVGVVYAWDSMTHKPEIPNVMLTVLGVVIGFVISYRAMSGYDRYWMGRAAWSDVIKNARTYGPPYLTAEETISGQVMRSSQELNKVMAEKRMALDLVLGFAVALKHHIRGELGIYYDDLYHLVRPLHDVHISRLSSKIHWSKSSSSTPTLPSSNSVTMLRLRPPSPLAPTVVTSSSHLPLAKTPPPPSTDLLSSPPVTCTAPSILPAQGSRTSLKHNLKRSPSHTSQDSTSSQHEHLLPGSNPMGESPEVAQDLIPFAGVFSSIRLWFHTKFGKKQQPIIPQYNGGPPPRKWGGPIHPDVKLLKMKAQIGENLPEEVLRCISEWCSVLEDRNTVGSGLGGIMGGIAAFEASLASTPPYLFFTEPTVWLYLFLLPFQLVNEFGWHTVGAVGVGAFIYLGFVAAGEEIEQPFGYDENDLDLDMFCQDIIAQDIESLKSAPCLNAYLGPDHHELIRHRSMTLTEATAHDEFEDVSDEEIMT